MTSMKTTYTDQVRKAQKGIDDMEKKEWAATEGIQQAEGNLKFIEANIHQLQLQDVIEQVVEAARNQIPRIQRIVESKNEKIKTEAFNNDARVKENNQLIGQSIEMLEHLRNGLEYGSDEGNLLSGVPESANQQIDQMKTLVQEQTKSIREKLSSNKRIAERIARLEIR